MRGMNIFLSKGLVAIIESGDKEEKKKLYQEINRQLGEILFDDDGGLVSINFKYIIAAIPEDEFADTRINSLRIPVEFVDGDKLDIESLKKSGFKDYSNSFL